MKELELLLIQFVPRQDQKVEACLKAVKGVLKKGDMKAFLGRLEGQKKTFELALLTLSMYSQPQIIF